MITYANHITQQLEDGDESDIENLFDMLEDMLDEIEGD
jgi:hypothetical protein